ncbi:MAG: CBS domain-containing protein [Nitrospira sp.]|nr:MAG: CBS domain-containing protein [Nitrospira sp.]
MSTMQTPGVPAGGFKTVGQIVGTNELVFRAGQNGLAIAVELLSSHTSGAPVVDAKGAFIGFISEFDVLKVLQANKELSRMTAEQIMAKDRIAVTEDTSIEEAVKIMEDQRLLNLPVKRNGTVTYSITRHDLLRAWIGLGLDIESGAP